MTLVFDLHCDTPLNIYKNKFNHIVPEKLRRCNYLGAVFAHFVYPNSKYPFVEVIKLISSTLDYIKKLEELQIIYKPEEIDNNKINIILGVEGGHIFDNTAKQIEVLYNLGARVFTLTWNNSNRLAHSALEADKKGLTKKGKDFLKELKKYDIILDLSHASTRTVLDVCELSENPIIASHSCLRALNPFLRNIDNQAVKAIAQRGGVVGINFSKKHLGDYGIFDHLDYLKTNFGRQIPAIGSDFDGVDDAVLKSPAQISGIEKELLNKDYSKEKIKGIFAENFLKVFKRM